MLWSGITHGLVMPLVVALGPERRNVGALLALVPTLAACVVFWNATDPWGVIAGMLSLLFWLRVMDARAWYPSDGGRKGYALFVNYFGTHPSEDREPAPARDRALRALRGCVLLGLVVGIWWWQNEDPLWRRGYFYGDSVLCALEVFMLFLGSSDLITSFVHTIGRRHFMVDSLDPRVLWSPSLAAFWGKRWNRTTAGSLKRGIFEPLGGRRHRVRGVLAVFFACGVLHALPLVLLTANRLHAWILVAGAMLFFMVHGLAILAEGALPRSLRRGPTPRVFLYALWALTVPLYPPLIMMMIGVHGPRPIETYALIRWFC